MIGIIFLLYENIFILYEGYTLLVSIRYLDVDWKGLLYACQKDMEVLATDNKDNNNFKISD